MGTSCVDEVFAKQAKAEAKAAAKAAAKAQAQADALELAAARAKAKEERKAAKAKAKASAPKPISVAEPEPKRAKSEPKEDVASESSQESTLDRKEVQTFLATVHMKTRVKNNSESEQAEEMLEDWTALGSQERAYLLSYYSTLDKTANKTLVSQLKAKWYKCTE